MYKKDESRKIRIETSVRIFLAIAFTVNKKDESRKIRIETVCVCVCVYKKDESRKIRIETHLAQNNDRIFVLFIRKMNPGK